MSNMPPIMFYHPDKCDKCLSRSIELYDYFHNSLGYRRAADNYMSGLPTDGMFNKRDIYEMRCTKCGQPYKIRWERDMPLPDTYVYHQDNRFFLEEFEDYKEQEETYVPMRSHISDYSNRDCGGRECCYPRKCSITLSQQREMRLFVNLISFFSPPQSSHYSKVLNERK